MLTVPVYMYSFKTSAARARLDSVLHIVTQAWTGCMLLVQIDAGAEVVITQPPLLWNRFEAWMDKVQQ